MIDKESGRLPIESAYAFGIEHGLASEVESIRRLAIDADRPMSVRRGYIIALFEENGLFEDFKSKHWRFGDTQKGQSKCRLYLRRKDEYEESQEEREPEPSDEMAEDNSADVQEARDEQRYKFALEAHLRDFLAKKPDCIENGLRLYQANGISGVEFQVDRGRIDILAVDRNDKFVVIELKLSKGRTKALGQLLYYMSWIDKHLGSGPCRGFIIANEIPPELTLSASRVCGVTLATYHMTFEIEIATG